VAIKTENGEESSEHASPEEEKWHGRDPASFVSRQIVRLAEVFFNISRRLSDLRVDHSQFLVFRRFRQNSTSKFLLLQNLVEIKTKMHYLREFAGFVNENTPNNCFYITGLSDNLRDILSYIDDQLEI
jgi:hypothetical protein